MTKGTPQYNCRFQMKNHDSLFLILGATFFLAAVSYALQLPANATTVQFLGGDPISYWEAARGIYTEGGKLHPLRPFFYPFLIGLPSLFFGEKGFNLWWVLSLNFIFWLSTVGFIFKVLINHTNRKIAFIGAFIFMSNSSNIINCWSVLAESLFHFLIVGSLYFFTKYYTNNTNAKSFIAFFTFFCFSFITRPTYFPLIFILIPLFIFAIYKRYLTLFVSIISLIIFTFTIGFSILKMHKTYGNYTLSYLGDCALYSFFGAYSKVVKTDKTLEQINADWRVESVARSKKMARYDALIPWSDLPPLVSADLTEQMRDNKWGLVTTFGRDLVSNSVASNGDIFHLINFENRPFFDVILRGVSFWSRLQNVLNSLVSLLMLLFFLRFRTHFYAKNRIICAFLGIICVLSLFTVLISVVSFSQGDRFHLVALPLNVVALGLFYFLRKY